MNEPRVYATRVRLEEADLKDIQPGSELHRRAVIAVGEAKKGAPYADYARARLHRDGELEFDDDATVSLNDTDDPDSGGAYVLAWVWIPAADLRIEGYLEPREDA
jgi:hypothetical protein